MPDKTAAAAAVREYMDDEDTRVNGWTPERMVDVVLDALGVTGEVGGLPDPPEDLADAWRRYQAGEHVEPAEARALDEWRSDCARDAGF